MVISSSCISQILALDSKGHQITFPILAIGVAKHEYKAIINILQLKKPVS